MKRVAIFGNAGGGKSTLAKRLAELTRLPLHQLDKMQYGAGGAQTSEGDYLRAHAELLDEDSWIIDGFGTVDTAWQRFSRADTLIHVDLALVTHFWWVTKRLLKSRHTAPEGWPEKSPMWRSTMNSYRVLWLCHHKLTPRYRQLTNEAAASKRVHHLRSPRDISAFLAAIEREYLSA
jgi:adenylate kinase family enzyme